MNSNIEADTDEQSSYSSVVRIMSLIWGAWTTPPVGLSLIIGLLEFGLVAAFAIHEIVNSSPPIPHSARNTPSPHQKHPGSSTIVGDAKSYRGSPSMNSAVSASLQHAVNNNQASSGTSTQQQSLSASNSGNNLRLGSYGSMDRNSNNRNSSRIHGLHSSSYGNTNNAIVVIPTSNTTETDSDPGHQGSTGDSTRKSFYNLLVIALLSRLCLLPVEAVFLGGSLNVLNPFCVVSRTLSYALFASAFSLFVLFYVQLSATASGRTPSTHNSYNNPPSVGELLYYMISTGCIFRNGNLFFYGFYFILILFGIFLPGKITQERIQNILWASLSLIYLFLFSVLAYFGPILVRLLKPSLNKRSALAIRLIAMCGICLLTFLSSFLSFGLAFYHSDIKYTHGIFPYHFIRTDQVEGPDVFVRDIVGYTLLEIIPSIAILYLMHQRRPQHNHMMAPPPTTTPIDGSPNMMQGGNNSGSSRYGSGGGYSQLPQSVITPAIPNSGSMGATATSTSNQFVV